MLLHRPKSRALMAGAALLSLLIPPGSVPADDYFETVYVPTSSVVTTLPTTSVLSTSYPMTTSYNSYIPTTYSSYIPTTYSSYIPTSYTSTYLPTSSIVATDSVLVPTTTTYFRPSIFRSRRLVERTSYSYATSAVLLPTTFVSSSILRPTSFLYDDSIVPTAFVSSPCDTPATLAPTRSTAKPPTNSTPKGEGIVSEPSNPSSTERRPSSSLNNSASGESGMNSDVVPPVAAPATQTPPAPKAATAPTEKAPITDPPVFEGTAPAKPSGAGDGGPVIPAPGTLGTKPPTEETMLRQARRPSTYETRNILRGRVLSADSKRPEEGVTVIISNETRKFADRLALTDADGEFKVSLPDGDWVVKVKMPSGSIFPVGRDYITASSGKITDVSGRNVGEMLISR